MTVAYPKLICKFFLISAQFYCIVPLFQLLYIRFLCSRFGNISIRNKFESYLGLVEAKIKPQCHSTIFTQTCLNSFTVGIVTLIITIPYKYFPIFVNLKFEKTKIFYKYTLKAFKKNNTYTWNQSVFQLHNVLTSLLF